MTSPTRRDIADHVNYLGLGGLKDWELMSRILENDYTFVTNNRSDFLDLHGQEALHPGVIIIVPNVTPDLQQELFRAVLKHIGTRDLTTQLSKSNMQEVASNAPNTSYRSNLRFQRGDRRRIFLDFYSIVPRRHTRLCRKTTSQREKWPSRESGVEKHLYGEIKGITSEHAIRAILARLQAVRVTTLSSSHTKWT
jgi:predicted nuclease of predicted toxin-antitoxin system